MTTRKLIMAALLAAGLCAGQAHALDSVASGYWTNSATWDGSLPGSDVDVVIKTGHTITNNNMGTLYASNLTIEAGAVLTHTVHASGDSVEKYKVILSIVSNLTINAGGAINVDAKGYYCGYGPGAGSHAAAHGGRAGVSDPSSHSAATTYGTITAPTNCGSGGYPGFGNSIGGGAVILSVGGSSTVNGSISACAGDSQYYSGSGGSIFLTTGALTGNGTLKANGGTVSSSGSGGGGRIAVLVTNASDFGAVAMAAYGGAGVSPGAPGTIYRELQGDQPGHGRLLVNGNGMQPSDEVRLALWTTWQNGRGASSYAFSEIVLTNGAFYMLDTNDVLDITSTVIYGDPIRRTDGITLQGGTLKVPSSDFAIANYILRFTQTNATFDPPLTSLTVGTNATLRIDVPWTMINLLAANAGGYLTFNMPLVLKNSLTLPAGAVMTHTANTSTEANKLNVMIEGSLTIETNGAINVDGKGYEYSTSPGGGPGAGWCAGYGGLGGYSDSDHPTVGATYGSVTTPTNCGSSGYYGNGGGAALLNVSGTTTVNGIITASGPDGNHYRGSGGSIYLTTGSLAGNGTLKANGGYYSGNAGGGGGRIAVILTNSTDFGSVGMQAYGGYNATLSKRGSAGTIYRQNRDQAPGRGDLIVDNNGVLTDVITSTFLWPNVTDKIVGTVIVTNAAKLALSNDVLTVYGDWRNSATFTGMVNSTVVFAGTNAATIRGTNTFYNFTSTNLNCTQESEAKPLYFQEARTNTVNGVLTLTGVRVDSIEGDSTWGLKANPALTHSVSNVWVGQSDASSGSQITAYDSTNMGGNVNWTFPKSGPTINTWLGAESTAWNVNGNWSENRPTIETDDVVIPTNSQVRYPVLDITRRVKSLAISNAASVSLGGFDLTVDTHLIVAGTLTVAGTATIRVGGDLDFSGGGTFNAASSTVWVAGSGAQRVVSGDNAFFLLTVSNSLAPVVFADTVTASNIVNIGTPVSFGGAVTVASVLRTYGTNVSFAGALTAGLLDNRNGGLVCSGAVAVATLTNWAGNLTFRDDVMAGAFYSAPGGMTHTFRDGKTVTVGNLEWYGRGGYPIVLRSASDGNAWNLNVTSGSKVRQVDVKDSNAAGGQTLYPVAATNSGGNTNWVFSGPWQTWAGTVASTFTNENNWIPALAPWAGSRLLIDGYYSNAPVLSGVATAAQLVVGGVAPATLTLNGLMIVREDVEILPRGTLTHWLNGGVESNRLCLAVGSNLTVHGVINVDGKGYSGGAGPGTGSAGAYGGQNGKYDLAHSMGATYGSVTVPTNSGSGGMAWNYGSGGGVMLLNVSGATTVNGLLSASGDDGGHYRGSGGSIFLTTGTLAGNGTVRANGGSYDGGACGGGGRVAVILTGSTDFGGVRIQAYGGYSSIAMNRGSAGTVYRRTKDQAAGQGTLTVDNNAMTVGDSSSTLINDKVTDTVVGTVLITNQAKVRLDAARSLTVNGDWLNAGTFIGTNTDATVILAGTNAAVVQANNTFYHLTCTNAGKTLVFEAGRTNTVTGLLKLGALQSGQMVTLRSTTNGSWSYLTLTPGGTQAIARVNVKDNNAGGGQTLLAGVGSVNGGNNINWQFPPSGTMFMVK